MSAERRKMPDRRRDKKYHHHRKKIRKKQRIASLIICICVFAVAAFVIFTQLQSQRSQQISSRNPHDVGSGYRDVVYNGQKYRYNNRITTILYAGIDSFGKMEESVQYGVEARADSIALVVLDDKNNKMSIVLISRDTMTDIRRYSMNGTDRGLYKTHLGYAYSYGDGGKVSCENLCEAVSLLFGDIPVNRYVVTNQDSMPYINDLAGGVTVTVPNDDLVEQYPQLYEGAQVTLTDETVRPFLQYRDTLVDFSNDGRMARQKAFVKAYIDKMKSLEQNKLEDILDSMDNMEEHLQTNITRNQYIGLADLVKSTEFSDDSFIEMKGQDQVGELHDEFYPDEDALRKLILDLFYEEV